MTLYRDTGVVLRVQKLGEADRIVTLLTRRHGKVRAVAKGVRRTRSRWGARLEPFNHVDVQCYTGRSLDVVTQAADRRRRSAPGIVGDYPRYTAGVRGAGDRGPAGRRGGRARAAGVPAGRRRDPGAGRPRARPVAGARRLPPARDDARRLGPGDHATARAAPRRARTGRSACGRGSGVPGCRPPGSVTPAPETFGLLDALLHGDWTVADAASTPARRETSGLVAAHLQWHLERAAALAAAGGAAAHAGRREARCRVAGRSSTATSSSGS